MNFSLLRSILTFSPAFLPLPLSVVISFLLCFLLGLWHRFRPKTILFILSAVMAGVAVLLSFLSGETRTAALILTAAGTVLLLIPKGKGGKK